MPISPPVPSDSQIGAWASPQSRPMEGRFVFEKRIAEYALKYGIGKVPRPPYWRGWRIAPLRIEFWRDRPFRLHDRLVYARASAADPRRTERLFPSCGTAGARFRYRPRRHTLYSCMPG